MMCRIHHPFSLIQKQSSQFGKPIVIEITIKSQQKARQLIEFARTLWIPNAVSTRLFKFVEFSC